MTREELIQKLLDFQRYKEAARGLRQLEERRRKCFPRGWTPQLPKNHRYPLREVGVIDLVSYLRDALERAEQGPALHEVQMEEIRLEERIQSLLERVNESDGPLLFRDLLERPWWRLEWIISFLAMLELMRLGCVVVLQEEPFGEIWLLKGGQPAVGAPQTSDEAAIVVTHEESAP
jgi:segregation and condensation protein A